MSKKAENKLVNPQKYRYCINRWCFPFLVLQRGSDSQLSRKDSSFSPHRSIKSISLSLLVDLFYPQFRRKFSLCTTLQYNLLLLVDGPDRGSDECSSIVASCFANVYRITRKSHIERQQNDGEVLFDIPFLFVLFFKNSSTMRVFQLCSAETAFKFFRTREGEEDWRFIDAGIYILPNT